jgi:hypothetical protein
MGDVLRDQSRDVQIARIAAWLDQHPEEDSIILEAYRQRLTKLAKEKIPPVYL